MPLEVIGAGFGRTGTMSLQAALDILYEAEGNQCYHYLTIITRRPHTQFWIQVLSGDTTPNKDDWEALFGPERFCATVDHPCANYYQELLAVYPAAKVILSKHPAGRDAWYASKVAQVHIFEALERWPLKPLGFLALRYMVVAFSTRHTWTDQYVSNSDIMHLVQLTERHCWGKEGGIHDRDNVLRRYDHWYATVPQVVPAAQLLEYDVSMGWEPLCQFLDKPVPDVPFPKETHDSSKNITTTIQIMEMCAWTTYTALAAVAVVTLARAAATLHARQRT